MMMLFVFPSITENRWVPCLFHSIAGAMAVPSQRVLMRVAAGAHLTIHSSSSQGTLRESERDKPLDSLYLEQQQQPVKVLNLTSVSIAIGSFSNVGLVH